MEQWKRRLPVMGGMAVVTCVLVVPVGAQASVAAAWSPQTSSGAYDFGQTIPGTRLSKTFHLTNSGSTETGGLRISITGNTAFRKMRDTCKGKSLAAGKSCLVRVTYVQTAFGADDSATLAATSLSGTAHFASLALTGSTPPGTPDLVITPTTSPGVYDFGTVSGTQTFTLTNNGTGAAQLISFAGDTGSHLVTDSSVTTCGSTLTPGAHCTLGTATYTAGACGTNTYTESLDVFWKTATDPSDDTRVLARAEDPTCP